MYLEKSEDSLGHLNSGEGDREVDRCPNLYFDSGKIAFSFF